MPSAKQAALKSIRILQGAGFETYLAGGCVRDMILGRQPKDYDVATAAPPDRVQELISRTKAIGKQFGVIQANIDGQNIEIATFRFDHNYTDGRHPSHVTFCSAREDAKRRDFTINAIFFDPITDRYIDYCHGIPDIHKRLLQCVGRPSERFQEDHLRMMRAIRFAHTLGFRIEPRTASAIRKHASMITRISNERVRVELLRILTESQYPGRAVANIAMLGLFEHILPRAAQSSSANQIKNIARNLNRMQSCDVSSMLTTLLLRTGARAGKRVARADIASITAETKEELLALRCSKNHTRTVLKAQALYWKIALSHPNLPDALLLELAEPHAEQAISALLASGKPYKRQIALLSRTVKRRLERQLISGDDLKAIGIEPGPKMKELLDTARILQAKGEVTSKRQALKLIRRS